MAIRQSSVEPGTGQRPGLRQHLRFFFCIYPVKRLKKHEQIAIENFGNDKTFHPPLQRKIVAPLEMSKSFDSLGFAAKRHSE
jgi:hypothetical protein